MSRTTVTHVLALFVLALVGSWSAVQLLVRQGIHLPATTWFQAFACLVLAGLVTWGGLTVRAYIAGKKPDLNGILASRIAIFAKACSLGGAIFVGWYGAQIFVALQNFSVESQKQRALWAGIALLTAVVLTVCGMIAERNCQIPPSSSDDEVGDAAGHPA